MNLQLYLPGSSSWDCSSTHWGKARSSDLCHGQA